MKLDALGPVLLVGAGKMGSALLDGWLDRGLPAGQVCVLEPTPTAELRAIDDDIDARLTDGDAEAYMRLNHAFHFRIYRASGSRVLLPLIDSLWLQFAPFMRTVYGRVGTASLVDQHKEAIRAIELADATALRAAISADITDGMGLLGKEILADA